MKKPRTRLHPDTVRLIEAAADRAAKRAAKANAADFKKLLLNIGINVETGEGVVAVQADAQFVRKMRLASESRPARYALALFSGALALVSGLAVLATQRLWPN